MAQSHEDYNKSRVAGHRIRQENPGLSADEVRAKVAEEKKAAEQNSDDTKDS